MTEGQQGLARRLAQMRESFDREFSLPRDVRPEKGEEFLIIVAGGQRHALRLGDILGLEHHRKVVPLPVAAAGLLGLAGIAGVLTPVFRLETLLGGPAAGETPPWLVVCKAQVPLALAFDRFDGCARIAPADVFTPAQQAATRLARQAVRLDGQTLYIIDVPAVVSTIKETIHPR